MIHISWLVDQPVPTPAAVEARARAYPRGPMPPRTVYLNPQPEGFPQETGAFLHLKDKDGHTVKVPVMRWRGSSVRGNQYPGHGLRLARALKGVGNPRHCRSS